MSSLIQSNLGGSGTGTTNASCTGSFASNTTNGNLLVLIAWADVTSISGDTVGFTTPTTPGFTWTASIQPQEPPSGGTGTTFRKCGVFYIPNAASMTAGVLTTVSVNSGFGSATTVECCLLEFSGIVTTSPLFGANSNFSQTSSQPSVFVGAGSTGHTYLVIMDLSAQGTNLTAGSGFTLGPTAVAATVGQVQYATGQSASSFTATYTGTESAWVSGLVRFTEAAPTTGNIIIQKVTHPMGSAQVFTFTPSWGAPFTLTDGTQHDSGPLSPGTYSVVETPVTNWSTAFSQNPSTIVVTAGNTTTVTFTNFFMPAPNKFITGMWQDPFGVPIAYGILSLKLNQDAVVISTTQIAPRNIAITLDTTGSIPNNTAIWTNDQLSPTGTFYALTIMDSGGGVVYGPQFFSIAGASPINLNNLVPVSGGSTGGGGGSISLSFQDSVQFISTSQAIGFNSAINTLILATAGVGGITLTLPSAVGISGQTMRIVMVDTGAGGVSVVTTGGQTISGRANYVLTNQWQVVDLESTNANWVITGAAG